MAQPDELVDRHCLRKAACCSFRLSHSRFMSRLRQCLGLCWLQEAKAVAQPDELVDFHHLRARRGLSQLEIEDQVSRGSLWMRLRYCVRRQIRCRYSRSVC